MSEYSVHETIFCKEKLKVHACIKSDGVTIKMGKVPWDEFNTMNFFFSHFQ